MEKESLLLIEARSYVYQLDKLAYKKLIKTRSGTKKPDLFLCKFKNFYVYYYIITIKIIVVLSILKKSIAITTIKT